MTATDVDATVREHTRCAVPGCHNLLRPTQIPAACSRACVQLLLMGEHFKAVHRQVQEAFRALAPVVVELAQSFKRIVEQVAPLFRFVLIPPRRTGPPPLCIDGHAYRNRTRRRTRKNRR